MLVWLVTLVRVVAVLLPSGPARGSLDVEWLVLLLLPVVVWKELAPRRGADSD